MDNRERDKFYSYTPEDDDDDVDLELEPPDAEVLAAEEHRAKEAIESHKMAIDIDELYREQERDRSQEILEKWTSGFDGFKFRFQVKHLLIATAVLAIALTLYRLELLGSTIVLLGMVGIIGVYLYLQWQEKKTQDELTRKRHEMYERRRAYLDRKLRPGDAQGDEAPATLAEMETLPTASKPFRFHFSMLEMMGAITVAAVVFGIMHLLGGPSSTATILGFLALIGLVVHALGFEPPGIVALGWWIILVLYVALSILAVLWGSIT